MIIYEARVYDSYVPSSTVVYSSVEHHQQLGIGDQIGLLAVVDHNSATNLTVQIEHSTDGVTFVNKRASASPELSQPLSTTTVNRLYAGESWPGPATLKFVRLRIGLTGGTPPAGHVQLFAVVHDRRGKPEDCGCHGSGASTSGGIGDDSAGGGGDAGDRPPRIVYGSWAQGEENRAMEVAFLKEQHPREAIAALRVAAARLPMHLVGDARVAAAIAALPASQRAELAEFGQHLQRVDPRSVEDALRSLLSPSRG